MPRPKLGPRLVTQRKPGRAPVFAIEYYDDAGRRRTQSTGTFDPVAAQAAFGAWRDERVRKLRSAGASHPSQVLIRHVLLNYAEEHGPDVESAEALAYAVEPMLWFFVDDTVATLTTARVKEYWAWRRGHSVRTEKLPDGTERKYLIEREIGNGTIIRELAGTLRPALRHAIAERRLDPGVYAVPVPSAPAGRDYWITRSDAAALLRAARHDPQARLHLPLYVLIAIYTGQRRRAILDLTWQQVDLARGRINFNPPGRIQTRKRRPHIPVPGPLLAALKRAHKRASCDHVVAYNGKPVGSVKKAFSSAARRAGLPDCTSHTLRHTAGTWMAQRGVPLWEIGGYLGHSVERTTELYAHHHPDFMANARKAMER